MAENPDSVSNLALIVFNENEMANIGAALQALADQMVSTSQQQMLGSNDANSAMDQPNLNQSNPAAELTPSSENQLTLQNKILISKKIIKSNLSNYDTNITTLTEEIPQKQHFDETNDEKKIFNSNKSTADEKNICELENDCKNFSDLSSCHHYLTKEEPQIQYQFIENGETLSSNSSDSIQIQYKNDNNNDDEKESAINYRQFTDYFCPECNVECGSFTKWKFHIEKQHKSNLTAWRNSKINVDGKLFYKCLDCKQKFSMRDQFRFIYQHRIKHLPYKDYLKCSLCVRRYMTKYGLHEHIKTCHSKIATPKVERNPSLKYINIFCPICQESQLDVNFWWRHLAEKHDYNNKVKSQVTQLKRDIYSCNICSKKIRKEYIEYHMLYHEPHKSFQCTLCNKYETRRASAIRHRRFFHNKEAKDCTDKMQIDDESDSDVEHSDSVQFLTQDEKDNNNHLNEKESAINFNSFIDYFCPKCNVECNSYAEWKFHFETQHKSTVTAWKNSKINVDGKLFYKCLDCDQTFILSQQHRYIYQHSIIHLPYKNYLKCRLCDKMYQTQDGVLKHIKIYHPETARCTSNIKSAIEYINIYCPICKKPQQDIVCWGHHLTEKHDYDDKVKSQVTQLGKHTYSCKMCSKKIREKDMKYHMLYHELHKSFQCTLCFTFATHPSEARQHARSHFSNYKTLIKCNYCDATFKKVMLVKHNRDFHNK